MSSTRRPLDRALYDAVVREAKKRFAVWPSAYASGWVVRTYKARGGRYSGARDTATGIGKWFEEKWVDLSRPIYDGSELVGYEPCGRPQSSQADYPKCRPIAEAMRMTPRQVASAVRRKQEVERGVRARQGRRPVNVPTYKRNPEALQVGATVVCDCGWVWEVEENDPAPLLCHQCGGHGVCL